MEREFNVVEESVTHVVRVVVPDSKAIAMVSERAIEVGFEVVVAEMIAEMERQKLNTSNLDPSNGLALG